MNNQTNKEQQTGRQVSPDTSDRVEVDTYDRGIVPAETAARREREGSLYKTHPTEAREQSAPTDDQTEGGSVHTTDGYTVDKEGLLNNYAIEPEMYYETPGDARQQDEAEHDDRSQEYEDISQESAGKLTEEGDDRGRGPGIV